MRILTASLLGFAILNLAKAFYLPYTDYPISPPGEDTGFHTTPPREDYHHGFTCPDGWTMHSTQCLLFVPQNMTWNDAKTNCESQGQGSLAAVYDDMQSNEIHDEMKKAGHHDGQVWVGGSRKSGDLSWSWGDYSIFDGFASFCDENHENNCLQLIFKGHDSGCLDDMRCDVALPSICAILLY